MSANRPILLMVGSVLVVWAVIALRFAVQYMGVK